MIDVWCMVGSSLDEIRQRIDEGVYYVKEMGKEGDIGSELERMEGWVNPRLVANDVEKILDRNTRGPKPARIRQLWSVFEANQDLINLGVSLGQLEAKFRDTSDSQNAVHDAVSRMNKALEELDSEYELSRTSIYWWRRKDK